MTTYRVGHLHRRNARDIRHRGMHDAHSDMRVMEPPPESWGNEREPNVVPCGVSVDPKGHELLPTVALESLIRQRDTVLERIHRAIALIREAHVIAKSTHLGAPRIGIIYLSNRPTDVTEEVALEEARRQIDRGGWDHLMSESGLLTFMDATAREEWRNQIESDSLPSLTADNIVATFRHVHTTRVEMFDRGIISLFQRLAWNYKTNLPSRFGKRLILGRLFTVYDQNFDHAVVHQATCDELDDLTRVFHVLDGKPEPDHRDGFYPTIHAAHLKKRMSYKGEYFSLKWFRKGSAHLAFNRKDLVDQMNAILVRHFPNSLPAPR